MGLITLPSESGPRAKAILEHIQASKTTPIANFTPVALTGQPGTAVDRAKAATAQGSTSAYLAAHPITDLTPGKPAPKTSGHPNISTISTLRFTDGNGRTFMLDSGMVNGQYELRQVKE